MLQPNISNFTNNTSADMVLTWKCVSSDKTEVFNSDKGFLLNIYFLVIINIFGIIFAIFVNSLVIYGISRNRHLGKIMRTLTIIMAVQGLFSGIFIQFSFVLTKFFLLTDYLLHHGTSTYCFFIDFCIAYAAKLAAGFSIVTILGVTFERYMAVLYPNYYKKASSKKIFLKVLALFVIFQPVNTVLGETCQWYKLVSKLVLFLQTVFLYIFSIYAHVKIHLKLVEMSNSKIGNGNNNLTVMKRHKSRLFASFLVASMYLICYFPLIIIRSLNLDGNYMFVELYLRPWCATFLFLSYSVQAIIYSWRSVTIIQPSDT